MNNLAGYMNDENILSAFQNLKNNVETYFNSNPFEEKEIGKLISLSVMNSKEPQKAIRYLERFLFGKSDQVGIVFKIFLLGKEGFESRLMELEKVLASRASEIQSV